MQNDPTHPQQRITLHGLTIETPADIDTLLETCARETPSDVDTIPYYAFLWPSALGLADHLAAQPPTFFKNRRIIELGCGLGLPSLLCARRGASVTATDFHPAVRHWLTHNATLNTLTIPFRQLDWNFFLTNPTTPDWPPADCIIGSDLLYERRHIPALVHTITRLTKPNGIALISDPGRDHLPLFVQSLENIGWHCELHPQGEIFVLHLTRS